MDTVNAITLVTRIQRNINTNSSIDNPQHIDRSQSNHVQLIITTTEVTS